MTRYYLKCDSCGCDDLELVTQAGGDVTVVGSLMCKKCRRFEFLKGFKMSEE